MEPTISQDEPIRATLERELRRSDATLILVWLPPLLLKASKLTKRRRPPFLVLNWRAEWERITDGATLPPYGYLTPRSFSDLVQHLWGVACDRGSCHGQIVHTSYDTFRERLNQKNRGPAFPLPAIPNETQSELRLLYRIVCDEAHALRSPDRLDSKLIQLSKFRSIFLLTATPLIRSFGDLHALLGFFPSFQKQFDREERLVSYRSQVKNILVLEPPERAPPTIDLTGGPPNPAEAPAVQDLFRYMDSILRHHPEDDPYAVSHQFWTTQGLSKLPKKLSQDQAATVRQMVSYILMQVMLRRSSAVA